MDSEPNDVDIFAPLALVWLVSAARVVVAFARHETFGAMASLAALVVVVLGTAFVRSVVTRLRARARRPARNVGHPYRTPPRS